MKNLLIILFSILAIGANAQIIRPYSMRMPPTAPTVQVTGSFSNTFASQVGTNSPFQSVSLIGINLSSANTITAGTATEVSLDNVTYGSSRSTTLSPTVPQSLFVRTTTSASSGSGSSNIVISGGGLGSPVNIPYTYSISSSATEALFNFTATAQPVVGWTNFFGDNKTNLSVTDASTGWILQTTGTNWQSFFGTLYGSNTDGASTGTFTATFPSSVVQGFYLNAGLPFNGTNYGFHMDNLPTGNYTIKIIGSVKSSWNNGITTPEFHVKFGPGSDQMQNTMNEQDNTQIFLTFTGSITSGQSLQISVNAPSSLIPGAGVINAIRILKN